MSTEMSDISTQLVEFVIKTKYTDIPEVVVELTKALTLKTVAGALAGSATPSGQKIAKLVRDRKLPEEAGVIGCGFKTSLWDAIFLNSFLAHAPELEDNRWHGGLSWDITVIPLLLSLAQKKRLSGRDLVEALAVGLEAHFRTTLFNSEHLGICFVGGAAGPAMAGAKALGLGVKETASALGLATSGVPIWFKNAGTDGHFFESALEALQGIMAAEMAKEGMTGNPDIATYLCSVLGKDKVSPERMVEGLGKHWFLREIWIKKYPCCWSTHRQIDALLDLMKEHDLSYEDVETIEADVCPGNDAFLDLPEPKTKSELQFSFQHVLGAALLHGDVNLKNMNESAITDESIVEARSKVKVIIHKDWPTEMMVAPGCVTLKTKDGRRFSKERKHVIGSLEEPLTTGQYRELYSKFAKGILPQEQIASTTDAILGLEKLADIEELMDALTFGPVGKKSKKRHGSIKRSFKQ